ncbi:MAG: methyltransferase domain-containing protein [Phycisphaerales bacterium]|nr:methyltransferase domain-containing protein [Phycisphaerales bacterium]
MLDRFDCYELCVQSPRHVVAFLRAAHGNAPMVLREDFCGTAAVARRWITETRKHEAGARAVGIDNESAVIFAARERAAEAGVADAVEFVRGDCTVAEAWPLDQQTAPDVVFVGNFSIGYIHRRADLLAYLSHAQRVLMRAQAGFGGGIFACDTYGGASAFKLGAIQRKHPGRAGEVIHYTWIHERADPVTAMVENSISFRVEKDGEIIQELPQAFTYRWRLWSIAELRDALLEVGFKFVEVYKDVNIAPGQPATPVNDASELGDDWIVMIVGRT